MNIYVGNLSQETSENQVRDAFAAYGDVKSVKLITDQLTGRLKGFGFVEMDDNGELAIEELNNSDIDGKTVTVNEARPKAAQSGFSSSRSDRRF